MTFSVSTISWVLAGLLSVIFFTLTVTVRSWREAKRSQYFFLRRQAELRMQQYGLTTVILGMLTLGMGLFAWNPPPDTVVRVALISSAKPVLAKLPPEPVAEALPAVVTIENVPAAAPPALAAGPSPGQALNVVAELPTELPASFKGDQPPGASLTEATQLGAILFSTKINDKYEAVSPDRVFDAGFYTLYATFSYDQMADGMEWAWVWRHNGEVVDGGSQMWRYGASGPGYVYFSPDDGFQPGEYTLQIYVNEKLLSQANLFITSAATSR